MEALTLAIAIGHTLSPYVAFIDLIASEANAAPGPDSTAIPPRFREESVEVQHALIRENPLGLLISSGP